MGTIIKVTSPDERAAEVVFEEFRDWEEKLSHFKKGSPISRLNRRGKVRTDPEVLGLIKRSLEVSFLSSGTFDITLGPIIDIWKKAIKNKRLPKSKEIDNARKLIGWENIYIDENKGLIKFTKRGMKIDLGAIAKGFALDMAVARLRKEGITSALINAGGDIYCLGTKYGRRWKVGLRHPRRNREITKVYPLSDKAIVTSGDYEQYFTIEGKRFSHIIDPRTGYPADSGICSVTVIAEEATIADALATAIFVLGEKKGLELAKKFNIKEVRISKDCF